MAKTTGINRLLLVRKAYMRTNFMQEQEIAPLVKEAPLDISPKAWKPREGISHYGYLLNNLKLDESEAIDKWVDQNHFATVLDIEKGDVDEALRSVGLRIHPAT